MTSIDDRLENILAWQRDHDHSDTKRFKEINETLKMIPCKEDIKEIVDESIKTIFIGKGNLAKNIIITAAVIITSITAIAFGIKTILGWVGITIINGK